MLKRVLSLMIVFTICLVTMSCSKKYEKSEKDQQEPITGATISGVQMEPDLSYTLYCSDTVVKGTVIREISEGHTNPSGTDKNMAGDVITYAVLTRYSFRVEESFLGDLKPGDEIVVGASNYLFFTYDELNDPDVKISTDRPEFKLSEGQQGVFCLKYDESYATSPDETCYLVTHHAHGVFTSEDGEHYVSAKGTEFDVSELPAVIEESKAKWDEIMKNTPEI